jgi:hypothetical protein
VNRARRFLFALVVVVAADVPHAQTRTSDGVSAILRGDFQQAAAILQPIAEDWRQRDPAAAFFMATLYDSGRGVALDPMRACALYQQAFVDFSSVYAPTAQLLQRRLWMARGNDWFQECQLAANIGVNHHFQNETFTLGAGHSVEWTVAAATVTYDGRTNRAPFGMMASRGTLFLPVQHAELRAAASSTPLHFFELFWWEPSGERWTLRARLFEVYRDELVSVVLTDSLTTATGAEPPSLTSSDLAALVSLRLSPEGAVELTTFAKGLADKRIIPSRAEKLAALEKERIRAAADARIDWNAALDVNRAPAMTYMEAQGCGGILLFASSEDRGEVISFRADAGSLELTPQARRFDLSKERRAFSLQIHVYERPVRADLCSDARGPMPEESAWQAVSGTVEIELSPRGVDPRSSRLRHATVRIMSAEFVGPSGRRIRLSRPVTLAATVGGVFG